MAIIRCSCGFFYDEEKYGVCPKCSGAYRAMQPVESVLPPAVGRGVPAGQNMPAGQSAPGRRSAAQAEAFFYEGKQDFFAGWLVCVRGAQKGRDFRIFPGFNRVGRQSFSDICLEDGQVARESHCAVVYEPKKGAFYLMPGKGTVTLLNERRIEGTEELEEGDRIGVGESLLVFIPFCGKERTWERW